MEPTGHYWKTLANYLILNQIKVVMVNPYHTKCAKELDDNSQTKNDKKDALTIAKLVADGRYYESYLPQDIFAELRVLSNSRISLMKRHHALKNTIIALLDEYFPEIFTVFKYPLKGKASLQVLKSCPFPALIKKKQALVVISKKIITVIYTLIKKQTIYNKELVFGDFRKKQLQEVA